MDPLLGILDCKTPMIDLSFSQNEDLSWKSAEAKYQSGVQLDRAFYVAGRLEGGGDVERSLRALQASLQVQLQRLNLLNGGEEVQCYQTLKGALDTWTTPTSFFEVPKFYHREQIVDIEMVRPWAEFNRVIPQTPRSLQLMLDERNQGRSTTTFWNQKQYFNILESWFMTTDPVAFAQQLYEQPATERLDLAKTLQLLADRYQQLDAFSIPSKENKKRYEAICGACEAILKGLEQNDCVREELRALRFNKALWYLQTERKDDALAAVKEFAKDDSFAVRHYYIHSLASFKEGDFEKARESINDAILGDVIDRGYDPLMRAVYYNHRASCILTQKDSMEKWRKFDQSMNAALEYVTKKGLTHYIFSDFLLNAARGKIARHDWAKASKYLECVRVLNEISPKSSARFVEQASLLSREISAQQA